MSVFLHGSMIQTSAEPQPIGNSHQVGGIRAFKAVQAGFGLLTLPWSGRLRHTDIFFLWLIRADWRQGAGKGKSQFSLKEEQVYVKLDFCLLCETHIWQI